MDDGRAGKGFTLIELVITIGIVSILSLVAVPSYLAYLQKGRRLDAITSLLNVQLRQAEWRANHEAYGSLSDLGWKPVGGNSLEGYYTVQFLESSEFGFAAVAEPVEQQSDDPCGVFAIDQAGVVYQGYADARCWNR